MMIGQDDAGDDGGDVEAQRPGGAVAKAADLVERRGNLAKRGRQPFHQLFARLRQGDAAGGAVEQAHAEPLFEPP